MCRYRNQRGSISSLSREMRLYWIGKAANAALATDLQKEYPNKEVLLHSNLRLCLKDNRETRKGGWKRSWSCFEWWNSLHTVQSNRSISFWLSTFYLKWEVEWNIRENLQAAENFVYFVLIAKIITLSTVTLWFLLESKFKV